MRLRLIYDQAEGLRVVDAETGEPVEGVEAAAFHAGVADRPELTLTIRGAVEADVEPVGGEEDASRTLSDPPEEVTRPKPPTL